MNAKLRFFEGDAKEAYTRQIKPALVLATMKEIEMFPAYVGKLPDAEPADLRFAAAKEEVTAKTLTAWAARHLREGKSVQWLAQNLLSSHEFEGSKDARESAVDGLAFLLQEPALKKAVAAGADLNRVRAEEWRQAKEAARKEYIERGQRVAPKDAELILAEDLGDYHPSAGCSQLYPEICSGNATGDLEIIGIDGGLVIFRKLKLFYYQMGVDAFHRNIGPMGMVASGVWEGSKGVLYAGALAAQKAGAIGRLLPLHPLANVAFRGLERAGSEGLKELDRMEAVRQGYIPYEQTTLEQMEEAVDYLDPTGLEPESKIPTSHETPRLSEHESAAPGAHAETVHQEGGSAKPSLEAGQTPDVTGQGGGPTVGKNVTPRTTEPPHEPTNRERIVNKKAQQNDSQLTLDDGVHGIAVEGTGKDRGVYFCSTDCPLLRDMVDAVVEVLPKNHPGRKDLAFLRDQIKGTINDLKANRINDEQADRLSKAYTIVLRNHADDPVIRQLLEMNPKDISANSAAIKRAIERHSAIGETFQGTESDEASVLEDPNARASVTKKPSPKPVPIPFKRGNFAHRFAEYILGETQLPRPNEAEVRVELRDGTGDIIRVDRMTRNANEGVLFEIKPAGRSAKIGKAQLPGRLDALQREFPKKNGWRGEVVVYTRADVEAWLRAENVPANKIPALLLELGF